MSIYEQSIKEHNNKLQEQIKKLQSKIKPVENPIIAKILPFLPYDVNKLILDKLDIEKQKYLLESEFDELVRCFVHNKTKFYTEDRTYWEKLPDNENFNRSLNYSLNHCINFNCSLKYSLNHCIREKICVNPRFTYVDTKAYILIDNFMREKIWTRDSHPNKDIENCKYNISQIYNEIDRKIDRYIIPPLEYLETIDSSRNRHIFTIYDYDYDDDNFDEYKIFKSNGSINSKQYEAFLENIRNIITQYFEFAILRLLRFNLKNIKHEI